MYQALIVSDMVAKPGAALRDPIADALATAGCGHVRRAMSIDEGLALLARLQPDLVVLDSRTACSQETYRRVLARLRGIPLIAIVDEAAMHGAFDAGVDDCLARPIRHVELVARARAAIRLRIERARRMRRDRRLSDEMTALQREKHDLERIVCIDSLTGVANRRHALALLDAEWKRSARERTSLSLVIVDLDCFHAFNEAHGHPRGDACLRRVTAEMAMCLRRPSDFLGRYGGEEFIAVLASTDAAGARIVAERLRAAVEALAIPHLTTTCPGKVVTISVGFATAEPTPERTCASLVRAADAALLGAKAAGRNRIAGDAPPSPAKPRTATLPWRPFPVVVADPWYADRIPPLLAATRDALLGARYACELANFERVRAIARRVRASAAEHRIAQLGELAAALEHVARDDNPIAIRRAIDDVRQYVEHVQVAYRRPLEQPLDHAG